MQKRALGLILFLLVVASSFATERLVSEKYGVTLTLEQPRSFVGPAHKVWPGYETWSLSRGDGKDASFLQVRIEPYQLADHRGLQTDSKVRESFSDVGVTEVKTIEFVNMCGIRTPVRKVSTSDGILLIADIAHGSVRISFELRAESQKAFSRDQGLALKALRSLQAIRRGSIGVRKHESRRPRELSVER